MPKKIMPRISHLKTNASSVGFLKRINIDIDKINLLIDTYNQAENQGTSITLLSEINKIRLHIQNDYSSYDMNQTIGFNNIIHVQLFGALKMACYDNQLTIYELSHLNQTQSNAKNAQDMFSEIIENMSPDKVSLLIALLAKPNVTFFGFKRNLNTDLNMLYSAHEKTTKEAREFDAFIQNNSIQYLAGKNSKIFKVSPRNEGKPFVVKIENRMGSPKKIENDLKTKLSCLGDVFIPSSGNRQGGTFLEGIPVTRNIIVNSFYSVGDLQSFAHQPLSEPMRAFKAIQIYKRMAIILNKIEEEYCFFPDMKNTNWIIDDNHHLLIGDTKSFRYTLIDMGPDVWNKIKEK